MKKKISILLGVIVSVSFLQGQIYNNPKFNLGGYASFVNNSPLPNNKPKGISLIDNHYFDLDISNYKIEHKYDPSLGVISIIVKNGRHELGYPFYISLEDYLDNVFDASFDKEIYKLKQQNLSVRQKSTSGGLIPEIVFKIPPGALPPKLQKFMGARLNLSGSQRTSISAGRTKRNTKQQYEDSSSTSLDINMRQDLDLNLTGKIGEKIDVTVKYNSNQETSMFDPNNINIKYTGEEDEIIQSIEAGNTSLSITGSRYVSASATSQGLFGVKALLKFGSLNITAIASKEESQKNTRTFKGSSSSDSTIVRSAYFTRGKRFYFLDPHDLYILYQEGDMHNGNPIPPGWVNNAIKTGPLGEWYVNEETAKRLPQVGTLEIFWNYKNMDSLGSSFGVLVDYETGEIIGNGASAFQQLVEDVDYVVNYEAGYFTLLKQFANNECTIGVAFTDLLGQQKGNTKVDYKLSDDENAPTINFELVPITVEKKLPGDKIWHLEAYNIYDLGMRNMRADGFDLRIYTLAEDGSRIYQVDPTLVNNQTWFLHEYLKLDSNGDGVVDGNDVTIDLSEGLIVVPMIRPFYPLGDTKAYEKSISDYNDSTHFLIVRGQIGRDTVNLGMMILPGSVRVRLNGNTKTENIDYLVDYDFGTVTFLTAEGRDPTSSIEISYENRPMFAMESKTLLGLRADWKPSDFFKLGSTFIYHSETVSDKRPKLGNEGRSLILANVDGEVSVEIPFITSVIDFIPLIKTDEMSKITVSGEIAMNAPSIHGSESFGDGKEAWIDDMESTIDSYPLGIMRTSWVPASEPYATNLIKARVNWFNPTNVYNYQVYDIKFTAKEKNEKVSVLDLKLIPPKTHTPGITNRIWGGLMKYMGTQIDFSEKEYIEFLVKVDSVDTRYTDVRMYLDFGEVSEDFYTDFGGKGVLNTEDGTDGNPPNNKYTNEKDIGLSGGHDPFDLFQKTEINGEYPYMNGTRNNGWLDTEDLNGNMKLDTTEKLMRYQVSLSDTTSSYFINDYNGWRLFRIPLQKNNDLQYIANINANAKINDLSMVRIWFESDSYLNNPQNPNNVTKIRLVYVDVVGNKWQKMVIKQRGEDDDLLKETNIGEIELLINNEYLAIETIDNQKSSKYTPPPKTTEKGSEGEISFEQSLMINYNNIKQGHISLINQKFREAYNLLSYNKLRYFIYTEHANNYHNYNNASELNLIFRAGADSINYYEISKPLPVNDFQRIMSTRHWQDLEISYTEITRLKAGVEENEKVKYQWKEINENVEYIFSDGNTYRMIGKPTLSNIREIAIGIQVPPNSDYPFNGIIYFNDIRVAEPNTNIGYAARTSFDSKFADFSTLRVDWEYKSADFYTTNSRTVSTGTTQEDKVSLSLSNTYQLQKFFPPNWGLSIPLNLSQMEATGIPRFKTNSDIKREILPDSLKTMEKNISKSRSADTSFRMTRVMPNKILEYSIRSINLNAKISESQTLTAARADTIVTYNYRGTYNITLPQEVLRAKIKNNYFFYFIPKNFNHSASLTGEYNKKWDYNTNPTYGDIGWRWRSQTRDRKNLDLSSEVKYDILTDMNSSFSLNTKRDLSDRRLFKKTNIGEETSRIQNIQWGYNPFYTEKIAPTQLRITAGYNETRKPVYPYTDSTYYRLDGTSSRDSNASLTLKNSDFFAWVANKLQGSTKFRSNTRESKGDLESLLSPEEPTKDNFDFLDNPKDSFDFLRDKNINLEDENTDDGYFSNQKDNTQSSNDEAEKNEDTSPSSLEPLAMIGSGFGFLSRLQNISLSYTNQYSTRFENRENRPVFLYQLGLPNILSSDELRGKTNSDGFTAGTGFPIFRNLVTDWRWAYQIQRTYTMNVGQPTSEARTTTLVWPDITASLNGFESIINMQNYMNSSRLSTKYSYTERLSGSIGPTNNSSGRWYSSEELTHTFGPLLGWNANWVNNITSSLSVTVNLKETNNYTATTTIRESLRLSYTGNIGYSFTAEQGISLPFIKRKIYFSNQFQTDLTVLYETEKGTVENKEQKSKQVERETSRVATTLRGSYSFSRNIKGGISGSYDINNNIQYDEKINVFRMEFWVEIIF